MIQEEELAPTLVLVLLVVEVVEVVVEVVVEDVPVVTAKDQNVMKVDSVLEDHLKVI